MVTPRQSTPGLAAAAACLLLAAAPGCKPDAPATAETPAPAAAPDACAGAPDLGWVAKVAEDPKALEGHGGAWVAFYKREYRKAAAAFEAVEGDPAAALGAARAHLRLGALHLAMARALAHAQVDYFAARRALGAEAKPLTLAPYFEGVALLMHGDAEAAQALLTEVGSGKHHLPGPWPTLAKALVGGCPGPTSGTAWAQVAGMARCAGVGPAPCGEAAAAGGAGDYDARAALYHGALCTDPAKVDEARLTELAGQAAATETLKGGKDLDVEVEYFDPLALWALGRLHLRLARGLAAGDGATPRMLRAWIARLEGDAAGAQDALQVKDEAAGAELLLAEAKDLAGLKVHLATLGVPAIDVDVDTTLSGMKAKEAELSKAATCVGTPAGQKVVKELSLVEPLARQGVRDEASKHATRTETCEAALRLLRSTQDIKNLEAVSYVNEPAFMVSLAEAALCMRRSAEAMGVLRAVRQAYPEAEGLVSAAQGLSVVRLMGGTGGTQKIQ